jgi:Zn-dependent peptidase ImmA (M78 family)
MREDGIRDARRAARGLLHRCGVRAAEHLVLESIAKAVGVDLVEAPLVGAKASLVRTPARAQIVLSDRVTDPCARRFSVGHELGHFLLRHPSRPPDELCKRAEPKPSAREREAARDLEAEANAFAAELLMPESLLRARCEVSPVCLDVPWQIAREFQVSILASAIRFAELSSERCAAVFSEPCDGRAGAPVPGGVVRWVAPSATFTRAIERGRRIDRQSIAWDYFAGREASDTPTRVPADAWLDTSADLEIVEHSITSPELGTVLTMLWVPEAAAGRLRM